MIHGTLGPRTLDPRHLRSWTNDLNVNSIPIFACPYAQSQWTSPTMVYGPRMSLSYREFIECRYIGLFRISYPTSHIEYLDMPSICLYFVFFRRKFSEKSENSLEIPKILRKFRKFSENSENSQKFLKIRRKFWKFAENSLKRRSFYEALISYRIVSYREKNPHIVSISYRVKKKLIALHWSCQDLSPNRPYQELWQLKQNNQLYQLRRLSLFKTVSPNLVVGLKNSLSSALFGDTAPPPI